MAALETSAEFAVALPVEDDNLRVANPEALLLHDELDRVVAKEHAWNYAMSQLQRIATKLETMKSCVKDMEFTSWISLIGKQNALILDFYAAIGNAENFRYHEARRREHKLLGGNGGGYRSGKIQSSQCNYK